MKDICKPATEGPRATTQAPVSVARSMTCRTSKHAIRNSNCWNEKKKQRNGISYLKITTKNLGRA